MQHSDHLRFHSGSRKQILNARKTIICDCFGGKLLQDAEIEKIRCFFFVCFFDNAPTTREVF